MPKGHPIEKPKGIKNNRREIDRWLSQHGDRNILDLKKDKVGLYVEMGGANGKSVNVYLPIIS